MNTTDLVREAITTRRQGSNTANEAARLAALVAWAHEQKLYGTKEHAIAQLAEQLRQHFHAGIPTTANVGRFWRSLMAIGLESVDWSALASEIYPRDPEPSPDPPIPHAAELPTT